MNIKSLVVLAGVGVAAAAMMPAEASAAINGWTVRGVTQHAGPGRQYPAVGFVPGGVKVRIFGCLRGITQCDISWRGNRGWVRGNALAGFYKNRRVPLLSFGVQLGIPYVSFNFGYWDNFYRNKPFFNERGKWDKDWKKKPWENGPKKISGPREDEMNGPGMGEPKPPFHRDRNRECKPGETMIGGACKPET